MWPLQAQAFFSEEHWNHISVYWTYPTAPMRSLLPSTLLWMELVNGKPRGSITRWLTSGCFRVRTPYLCRTHYRGLRFRLNITHSTHFLCPWNKDDRTEARLSPILKQNIHQLIWCEASHDNLLSVWHSPSARAHTHTHTHGLGGNRFRNRFQRFCYNWLGSESESGNQFRPNGSSWILNMVPQAHKC